MATTPDPDPAKPATPPKTYGSTTAQPYVWSPGEKQSIARTREGGPNPWAEAATAAHAEALAKWIVEKWREQLRRPDRDLPAWLTALAAQAEPNSPLVHAAVTSIDGLAQLDVAALREIKTRLDTEARSAG